MMKEDFGNKKNNLVMINRERPHKRWLDLIKEDTELPEVSQR